MSVFDFDLPAPGTPALRRFTHATVVPTSYDNKGPQVDSLEEQRAAAARQGYQEGYAEGLERAAREQERRSAEESQRAAAALAALSHAVSAVHDSANSVCAQVQEAAPKLAYELLEILLAREVSLMTSPGAEAITRVLRLDEGSGPVTVWMHPSDVAALGELAEAGFARDVNVIADPSVEKGGAVAEVGRATFDGQLTTALERVREVLLGGEQAGRIDERVA